MDKLVKTRVHELLGVEPGEIFNLQGKGDVEYKVNEIGVLFSRFFNGISRSEWEQYDGTGLLSAAIQRPEIVLLRPALNDEQQKVLLWLHKGGFTHVTKDDAKSFCTDMCAMIGYPERGHSLWVGAATMEFVRSKKLDCLRPLIPDWTVPLDIEKTLRDAGVEA